MRRYLPLIVALLVFIIIHEGLHALTAAIFNEYRAFRVHLYGLEVIFKTPVAERTGMEWGFISGVSNAVTLLIGYILFACRKGLSEVTNIFLRHLGYWAIFIFMLFDAFNLSIIPFFFGGDIGGIVQGFGINRFTVQALFLIVLLINRELIVRKVFPLYGIKTRHFLFQPFGKGA